jgi:hypothetical protein
MLVLALKETNKQTNKEKREIKKEVRIPCLLMTLCENLNYLFGHSILALNTRVC